VAGGASANCASRAPSDGACGPANGAVIKTTPSEGDLCAGGTPDGVTPGNASTPWTWSCRSDNTGGQDAACASALDGVCGPATGGIPNGSSADFCSVGTPSSVSPGSGSQVPWSWVCLGVNGGNLAYCQGAAPGQDGACGPAAGTVLSAAPAQSDYCSVGAVATVSQGSATVPWTWTCLGVDGGSNAACASVIASNPVNGVCGAANGAKFAAAPSANLCASGTASAVTGNGPWTWSCAGANGGSTASCGALLATNGKDGVCGTANNTVVAVAPAANLCSSGQASNVIGNGPWVWTCGGTNGGNPSVCVAWLAAVNGACGPANNRLLPLPPAGAALCNAGAASPVAGGAVGPWTWTCAGNGAGMNANCQAKRAPAPINGVCGIPFGAYVSKAPAAGLCAAGVAGPVGGAGPWTWVCNGVNGGLNAFCRVNPIPAAVCGAANGQATNTAPTTNLCTVGTASTVSGSGTGPFSWTCSVGKGGIVASCSTVAPNTRSDCLFNWAEDHYASLLATSRPHSLTLSSYYYRYYWQTNSYLGTSSSNQHLYFVGAVTGGNAYDLGPVANWYTTAGCP
jgi:hypothetical protein